MWSCIMSRPVSCLLIFRPACEVYSLSLANSGLAKFKLYISGIFQAAELQQLKFSGRLNSQINAVYPKYWNQCASWRRLVHDNVVSMSTVTVSLWNNIIMLYSCRFWHQIPAPAITTFGYYARLTRAIVSTVGIRQDCYMMLSATC